MKTYKYPFGAVWFFIITFAVSLAIFSGCKNESPVVPQNSGDVSVGLFAEQYTGDNTLLLSEVKFLLRKVVLKAENSEEIAAIDMGPVVVKLDVFARVSEFTYAAVIPGAYDEIHFQLHKPSPNEIISDPEFTESINTRYSVIVRGIYNGVSFIYKTDITVSKEIGFENHSLTVPENGSVHITIRIDPYLWFMNSGTFLDPAGADNKRVIDDNIRDSFRRAFKDNNNDGEPD